MDERNEGDSTSLADTHRFSLLRPLAIVLDDAHNPDAIRLLNVMSSQTSGHRS